MGFRSIAVRAITTFDRWRLRDADTDLATVMNRDLTGREADWGRRIEARRQSLCRSDAPVDGINQVRPLGEITAQASAGPDDCGLLLRAARELAPDRVLELGTCVGISGAYMAAGLELAGGGRLVTVEGVPGRAEHARATFTDVGLSHRVDLVIADFDEALDAHSGPFGVAFVDGHHLHDPTLRYFKAVVDRLDAGGLIVFDDVLSSSGMRRAWRTVASDGRAQMAQRLGRVGLWRRA